MVPKKVSLKMPIGDVWCGTYLQKKSYIRGLKEMMQFYDLKPYYVYYMQYTGCDNFNVEIFNSYAMEIEYACKEVTSENGLITDNSVSSSSVRKNVWTDEEVSKLCANFCYSALYNSGAVFELIIEEKHLQHGLEISVNFASILLLFCLKIIQVHLQLLNKIDVFRVFSKTVGHKLGLDERICHVELKVMKLKQKISLRWKDDVVLFDRVWCEFATAMDLSVGDVCVFQYTKDYQKFKIAVLEKKTFNSFNKVGKDFFMLLLHY